MRFRIRHRLTVALTTLLVVAFIAAFLIQKTDFHYTRYDPFKRVELGMPRETVLALLGQPDSAREIANQYDLSYKVKGYTFRAFTSGGMVWVYQRDREVCYVLLANNRVAEISIGHR